MIVHFIVYSLKENKNVICVTIFAFVLLGFLCLSGNAGYLQIMRIYEMFLLPFMGCWIVCGFWDYIDQDVREAYLSYPKSRLVMGVGKIFCLTFVFFLLYCVLFLFTFMHMEGKIVYLTGMCFEILFWSFLGFFLIVKTKNMIMSISMIWIYTAAQVLDVEKYFEKISIYIYNCDSIEVIWLKGGIVLLLGIILMVRGQKEFNNMNII